MQGLTELYNFSIPEKYPYEDDFEIKFSLRPKK